MNTGTTFVTTAATMFVATGSRIAYPDTAPLTALVTNTTFVRSVTTGTTFVTTTVFVNTCTTGALVHVTSSLYARSSVEHPLATTHNKPSKPNIALFIFHLH